jgi:hypothetical protein
MAPGRSPAAKSGYIVSIYFIKILSPEVLIVFERIVSLVPVAILSRKIVKSFTTGSSW